MADGQTIILRGNRETAHRIIDVAPPGSVLNIKPPRRSLDQNAKMWAMLSDISRAKPEGRVLPPRKWKCLFMDALGEPADWEPGLDGQGVVNCGYRSSALTKAQMADLITLMDEYGARHGVEWSDPETRRAAA